MKDIPVFEVRGRSLISAVGYTILCLILFGLLLLVFHSYINELISLESFIAILIIELAVIPFTIYATYLVFKIKRFVCDGQSVYLYYGRTLKKRIHLADFVEIGADRFYLSVFVPLKAMYIQYKWKKKIKQLFISEDTFKTRDIIYIFRELSKYATTHNVIIFDANHWLNW